MADLQSLVDHIHYDNKRDYDRIEGDIAYLDGSPLTRPFAMPKTQRLIAAVIIAVAIVIGLVFANSTVVTGLREMFQTEQIVTSNLAREASIETIPQMSQLVSLENGDILTGFLEAGYIIYDASDPNDPSSMLLYKLPNDMSVEEAAGMYARGISKLPATQASKLLNGSWSFSVDRNGTPSMVTRYADFSTGDPAKAVQNALGKEGIPAEDIAESGVDESGNTYSMGTIDASGIPCTWKISALLLSDMYSVTGLPEDVCYVGVRFTLQ